MATMAPSHSSSSTSRFSCPCKRIPLSLSSATSAEYGDVASLARRMKSNATVAVSSPSSTARESSYSVSGSGSNGQPSIPGGISNGGITPLHLAAQHGHPAAVSMLLKEGSCEVDSGLPIARASNAGQRESKQAIGSGATPLHRAAFSGAISSMQILLSWCEEDETKRADLLARDLSFGDKKTPLHKAVAGGRPLAVQLLINALQKRHLLTEALQIKDASGLTPLELAKQFTSLDPEMLEQERQSVRRWDVVAGGDSADWDTCLRLLKSAAATISSDPNDLDKYTKEEKTQQSKSSGKDLPEITELENIASSYCDDGDECQDGRCRTTIWENAFRMALTSSMEMSLNNTPKSTKITKMVFDGNDNGTCLPCPTSSVVDTASSKAAVSTANQKSAGMATKMGRQCDSCGKHSPALFRSGNQLVCRQCRRRINR